MTFIDNPYNRRQFLVMRRFIEEFKAGSMGLGQLIINLESLFASIKSPEPQWSGKFQVLWAKLEEEYAVMIHHHRTSLDPEAEALVDRSANELLALVDQALGSRE